MLSLYCYRVISIASNEMVRSQSLVVQARELIATTTVINCLNHLLMSIVLLGKARALLIIRPISKVHILYPIIVTLYFSSTPLEIPRTTKIVTRVTMKILRYLSLHVQSIMDALEQRLSRLSLKFGKHSTHSYIHIQYQL